MKKQLNITNALKNIIKDDQIYNSYAKYAKKIASRWQSLGLLQGITNKYKRYNTALCLQNEAKHLIREANYSGQTPYHEEWSGIALPLVRRYLMKVYAQEWVSLQTMPRASGLVFFIDHQYGTDRQLGTYQRGESIYGTSFEGQQGKFTYIMNTDLAKGLYGAGKFGYTLNHVVDSFADGEYTVVSGSALNMSDINYNTKFYNGAGLGSDSTMSESFHTGKIKKISILATSMSKTPDLNGVEAYALTSSGFIAPGIYPLFTVGSSTQVTFYAATDSTGSFDSDITMSYHRQTEEHDRGDFEWKGDDPWNSGDLEIPEVKFELTQKPIVAKTRKLKARWTQELIDDLNSYLAIDGQAEISNQLSDQVAIQTDLEILAMIKKGARGSGNVGFFSARPSYEPTISGTTVTFESNERARYINKGTWYENIRVPMQSVSNKIGQKIGRGGANFAIVSPALATIIETIEGFVANTDGQQEFFDSGFKSIGTFKNRFKMYKNPYDVDGNEMIMGYRGSGVLDFGAVYAPYIPLVMLPMIYEPTNFVPTKGVYTRYAKTMLRQDYYGLVIVDGLQTVY